MTTMTPPDDIYATFTITVPMDGRDERELEPIVDALEVDLRDLCDSYRERRSLALTFEDA